MIKRIRMLYSDSKEGIREEVQVQTRALCDLSRG